MRVNDEVTSDYILEIETDNFNLRVENEEQAQEIERLKVALNQSIRGTEL